MSRIQPEPSDAVVVEEEFLTLVELSCCCQASSEELIALVQEGALDPSGDKPEEWRFSGAALRRARIALRLSRDLHLNKPGVALALELLDQIEALKARLRRTG